MADKSLKISVKTDLKDGQKLSGFLTGLQKQVDKLGATLRAITIGGGGPDGRAKPGQPVLAKQLSDDKKGLEGVGREVDNLQRKFQNLSGTLTTTASKLQQISGGGLVDQYGRPVSSGAPGGGGGPPPTSPPAPGGAGGAGSGSIWSKPVGQALGLGGGGGVLGPAAALLIANAIKNTILGSYQRDIKWATLAGDTQAYGGQAQVGELGARMARGDMMPAVGMWRAMGNGGSAQLPSDMGMIANRSRGATIAKGVGLGIQAVTPGATLDPTGKMTEALMGATNTGQASDMLKLGAEQIKAGERQDLVQNEFINYAQAQAPGRVGFARKFGRDFSAGTALGSNVDPQQVMATVSAVLEALGSGAQVQKVTRLVTEATRLGLSNEAISSMLRASEIGGGDLMGKVLRSGMSRPMMGMAGMSSASMAEQSLMALNPDSFVGGFTSGGAGTNALNMRQLQAGAGFLGQATTGGLDAYQSTVNMALATKSGRSVYTTGVLGKMPFNELLNGAMHGPTAEQKAAGMTQPMMREQLDGVVNSLAQRAVSEGGETTPAVRRLLEASRGEGGVAGAIRRYEKMGAAGQQARVELNTGLNLVADQPLGTDAVGFFGGATNGSRGGRRATATDGAFGGANSANLAGAKYMEGHQVDLTDAIKILSASVKVLPDAIRAAQGAQLGDKDSDAARGTLAAMGGIGKAMQQINANASGTVNVMAAIRDFATYMNTLDQKSTAATNWRQAGDGSNPYAGFNGTR